MKEDGLFHILSLDGGGARGIYPAQILASIEKTSGIAVKDHFDLIAGTSTGSIIAGAAAAGIPLETVVDLFERHSARIFKKRLFHRGIFRSKYPSGPLREMVQSHFPTVTMGKIPTPLLITSSDISTGGVYVFKSRYMEELGEPYVRDRDIPLHDAILASCAAPTYFDPVQVGRPLLADGGLWANNPSILAVTEAISKFGRSVEQIHILSIGTGHSPNLYRRRRFWGIATGWGRTKLVSYFLDLQSQSSTNMARLILENRYVRLDPDIEDWDLDDTDHLDTLKALADRDFTHACEDIMRSMRRRR